MAVSSGLKELQREVTKKFGEGTMRRADEIVDVEVIPSGSLALDRALGVGGLAKGYQYELSGMEQSGKSALSMIMAASIQKNNPEAYVALIEPEHQFDPPWAAALGVDMKRLYHVQPDTAEQTSDLSELILRSGEFAFVIVDSIGAMSTQAELEEKKADEMVFGGAAKIITRMVKNNAVWAAKTQSIILYINQVRANTGQNAKYDPLITPGGEALKHMCKVRMKIARTSDKEILEINKEKVETGYKVKIRVFKNKLAPPKREASYWFYHTKLDGIQWRYCSHR